jgi:hypothetical protein
MNEEIKFEIYFTDRTNLQKVKKHFGFVKDEQALVFCLGFVAENILLVKRNTKRVICNKKKDLKKKYLKNNSVVNQQNQENNTNSLSHSVENKPTQKQGSDKLADFV